MDGMAYIDAVVEEALSRVRTAYKGKVLSVNGNKAIVQPLDGGNGSPVSAVVPPNIKCKAEKITFMVSSDDRDTKTFLMSESLKSGDIVFVGVSDRDISNNPTKRHHNINDGVILRVL